MLNAPESFEAELSQLSKVAIQQTLNSNDKVNFALRFTTTQAELDAASGQLIAAAEGDVILWFAYPKKTSKHYQCEFNRDTGWQILGSAGHEGVRQIAIDADWSALRFRHVQYIKSRQLAKKEQRNSNIIGELGKPIAQK